MNSDQKKNYPLISIIVPVYNVENYLTRCLNSIINQTYENLEIILVNDGSTDGSPAILHEYELLDRRVKVIQQKNKGLSGARNTGIQHANATYLMFIDSDDYIIAEMAELLFTNLQKYESDISICGYFRVDEQGNILSEHSGFNCLSHLKPVFSGKELFKENLEGRLYNMAWNKLYKKSLFTDNNIEYPPGLYHEDIATTFKLFWHCQRISIFHTPCYYWLIRDLSISNTFRKKHIEDYLSILEINEKFLKMYGIEKEYFRNFRKRCKIIVKTLISKIFLHDDSNELLNHLEEKQSIIKIDSLDIKKLIKNELYLFKIKTTIQSVKNITKNNSIIMYLSNIKSRINRLVLRVFLIDTYTRPYKDKFNSNRFQLFFETLTYKLASKDIGITRNTRNIIKYHNLNKGKRAFLIGNGPSLNQLDLTKLKNEISIGVNSIYLNKENMGFLPTHYIVEDIFVAEDRKNEINELLYPQKWFGNYLKYCFKEKDNEIINWLNVRFDYRNYPDFPHFSTNIARQAWVGGTVSYIGLQLAYYLGIKELYLIGFDHHYLIPSDVITKGLSLTSVSDDPNHFHPDYFGKGYRWHDPNVERMERGYIKAKKYFEQDGRKIYNATAGGKLEVFERVDFYSLFK